jgi:hypothetical protein
MNTSSRNQKKAGLLGEFLNPKSMLTPGVAGATTMFITNALCTNFSLPRPHVALTISALLGILTVGIATVPMWQKFVFAVFNSLFIFAMAVGTNTVGVSQFGPKVTSESSSYVPGRFASQTLFVQVRGGDDPIPDGVIVKGSGPDRFLIEGGLRRLIPDEETFKAMGFKSENVKVISDSELNSIPLGKPLPSKTFFSPWFH